MKGKGHYSFTLRWNQKEKNLSVFVRPMHATQFGGFWIMHSDYFLELFVYNIFCCKPNNSINQSIFNEIVMLVLSAKSWF
jgi:hypothetical protein